jgi:hypothetical protein
MEFFHRFQAPGIKGRESFTLFHGIIIADTKDDAGAGMCEGSNAVAKSLFQPSGRNQLQKVALPACGLSR